MHKECSTQTHLDYVYAIFFCKEAFILHLSHGYIVGAQTFSHLYVNFTGYCTVCSRIFTTDIKFLISMKTSEWFVFFLLVFAMKSGVSMRAHKQKHH